MRGRLLCWAMLSVSMMSAGVVSASENAADLDQSQRTPGARAPQTGLLKLSDADLFKRVEIANEDLYASLKSFVCDERIERTREDLKSLKVRKLDTLAARVSFENGREEYSNVRQNGIGRTGLAAAGGAWSEGEFGTLLRQTQQLLQTQEVTYRGSGDQDGQPAAFFSFDVSQMDSPWTLVVEGRPYKLPFRTEVSVEAGGGHILSVKRTATQIPRELFISEIEWAVTMAPADLAGSTWLLPSRGEYAVWYANSNRRERNWMTFGHYQRYGAEVALLFDPVK